MFQSAPPVKGATPALEREGVPIVVSIRAPREGGDSAVRGIGYERGGFNPRPP